MKCSNKKNYLTFNIPTALSEHTESGMAMPILPPSKCLPLKGKKVKHLKDKNYRIMYIPIKTKGRNRICFHCVKTNDHILNCIFHS